MRGFDFMASDSQMRKLTDLIIFAGITFNWSWERDLIHIGVYEVTDNTIIVSQCYTLYE